jgi:hypothetical protein
MGLRFVGSEELKRGLAGVPCLGQHGESDDLGDIPPERSALALGHSHGHTLHFVKDCRNAPLDPLLVDWAISWASWTNTTRTGSIY